MHATMVRGGKERQTPARRLNLKVLVGSGDSIGKFVLPFLLIGVIANVLWPSLFSVGGPPSWLQAVSILMLVPGIAVWAWTVVLILTKVPRGELITTGPFALTKHPLYTDVAIFVLPWVGFLLNTWLGLALGAVMLVAASRYAPEEERALAETFGTEWDAYAAEVEHRGISALLICGIASSLVYVLGDLYASWSHPAYSYANQAVSELAALGAPTRPLMLGVFTVYNILVVAFAVGVWRVAGARRSLRLTALTLGVYAVVGEITQLFSPMSLRGGSVMAPNDVGHIALTAIEVLSIVLFIAFGSGARGRGFRVYSLLSIALIIGAGILAGLTATNMTAEAASTPFAGILERVNIYATMLWIASFGGVLLAGHRAEQGAVSQEPELRPSAAALEG